MSARGARVWKRVAVGMGYAIVAALFLSVATWDQYFDHLPRQPQPPVGRVCRINMNGVTVYGTRSERREVTLLAYAPWIGGALLMALLLSARYASERGVRGPRRAAPASGPPGHAGPPQ
jgi:hypothetical protein